MIDIHCHILPGIDDGPSDLAGSLEMARAAAAAGITTAVATPHLRADFPKVRVDEVADRCAELREAIRSAGIELELVPGGEVSLSWALDATDDRLRLASYGQRGTDLLIETPSIGGPMLPQMLSQIASRGYRVVLAHPERLQDFQDDPAVVERLTDQGVVLQINADAVSTSSRRSPVGKLARRLCSNGQASVVASDGHRGARWRPVTSLAEAGPAITRLLDERAAMAMLESAPRAILEAQPLPRRDTVEHQRRARRWRR